MTSQGILTLLMKKLPMQKLGHTTFHDDHTDKKQYMSLLHLFLYVEDSLLKINNLKKRYIRALLYYIF